MRSATRGTARTWMEGVLWTVAAVGLGAWLFAQGSAWNYQRLATRELAASHAAAPGTPRLPPAAGEPLGRLSVPRLDLNVVVAEGDSTAVLRRAVGHVPDTALPGGAGNVVLAGHRDTFFRPLRNARPGDIIRITTPHQTYAYQVEWTRVVTPTAVEVMRPAPGTGHAQMLTLITCYPFYYVGPAPRRFVVRARALPPA